jgi:outer membrane protein TolC
MQALEAVRRVLEVDVLTSRLNVLHEEARINSLEKELYRQKVDMQKTAGFPVAFMGYTLKGEITPVRLDMERCVDVALRRSTAVARARAEQDEQERVNNWWEYGPSLNLGLKYMKDKNTAGVSMDRDNGTYNVTGFAEQSLKGPDSVFYPGDPYFSLGQQGWRLDIAAEFPIFQGLAAFGKQKRERSLLQRSSFLLRQSMDSVELSVRKAYQNMLEQEKGLEILKETASISHERLKIQESLKDMGKITDNELETFRNRFFDDQSEYYNAEAGWIATQEELRYQMRWFEPDTGNTAEQ